ncbi:MAG: DUF3473 domain-containing protein [Phycisphaerales bacterium]|nr:MAG: DUF3473 domain-containing protein [Phycisphaerales bacterium]
MDDKQLNAMTAATSDTTGPATGTASTWNVLTFDVEEWFHAANLRVPRGQWGEFPSRLGQPVEEILSLLEQHARQATFFVLGWVAQRRPDIVRRIAAAGHEIASHGYWHTPVTKQTREEFRQDVKGCKAVLEDITGHPIVGYRAPGYSVNSDNEWALDELKELGFLYDSSIYPARAPHGRYGAAGTPLTPYRIRRGLWEFPLPTWEVMKVRLPAATGGYLRLCPLAVTERALKQNIRRNIPVVVNIHPWELDPVQPRWPAPWWNRALHYTNLHTTKHKLSALLRAYRFTTVRNLLDKCHQHDAVLLREAELPTTQIGPTPITERPKKAKEEETRAGTA